MLLGCGGMTLPKHVSQSFLPHFGDAVFLLILMQFATTPHVVFKESFS